MDVEHRKIVDKLRRIDCTHADATAAADLIDTLAAEVRRLSGAVPAGCVRDVKGVDRKVLGLLPVTEDECVIGNQFAEVWALHKTTKVPRATTLYHAGFSSRLWSTRAAAEAARERGGT